MPSWIQSLAEELGSVHSAAKKNMAGPVWECLTSLPVYPNINTDDGPLSTSTYKVVYSKKERKNYWSANIHDQKYYTKWKKSFSYLLPFPEILESQTWWQQVVCCWEPGFRRGCVKIQRNFDWQNYPTYIVVVIIFWSNLNKNVTLQWIFLI